MAYAALSSLIYTLKQLFKPNEYLVCQCCTQQHVESLCQSLSALQDFLDDTKKDIETLKVVEKRIRNVIYKAEDRIDSSLRNILLADHEDKRKQACRSFYEDLLKVEKQVYFLNKEVMVINVNKHGRKSVELATTSSSPDKSTTEENTIVGMEDDFNTILDRLISQTNELTVIPIFGMGGIEELETLHIKFDFLFTKELDTIDLMISSAYNFPPNLKKLTLSSTELPWDVMNLLAYIPKLEVLKANYAFNGTDWKLDEDVVFHKLKYLQIKSDCLVRWEAGSDSFPMLEKLLLYDLNELEEIPESIGDIMTLKLIQIHRYGGKNGSGVEISAKKIQEEQENLGNYELQVQII